MSMDEKKRNGAMRLFEALSGVDQELLEKCEEEAVGAKVYGRTRHGQKFGRKLRYGGATLAAAVCVLAVGLAVWQANGPMFTAKDEACAEAPAALAQNAAGTMQDAAMPETSMEEVFGEDNDWKEYAYAATEERKDAGEGLNATDTMGSNGATESLKQEAADITNGNQEKYEEQLPGMEELKQSLEKEQTEICIDSAVGKDNRQDITEAQARELEVLGAHIPTVLPADYTWESGLLSAATETETERVFLTWTKGMDSIEITLSRVETDEVQLTDIRAEETYNVHLYDIPYAETLPKEYRDTFNDPVFAAKELSLQLIEKRMKSFSDAGDTDTPRGNFSVLYEDGVLVRFGGRGTAQEIWEMFVSME